MSGPAKAFPYWFLLAFVPMVASQIARLYQTDALGWCLCDYSGRIGALVVLAAIPTARAIAFRHQPLRCSWWETGIWVFVLAVGYPHFSGWLSLIVNTWMPLSTPGTYFPPEDTLRVVDLTFGLALVAVHEEIIFRRCARAVLSPYCGDGAWMVLLSAILFAAYHWTTSLGNIASVYFFGLYAMLFYKRAGSIWSMMLAHYLADLQMSY